MTHKLGMMEGKGINISESHFTTVIRTNLTILSQKKKSIWYPTIIIFFEKNDSVHFSGATHGCVFEELPVARLHMTVINPVMTLEQEKINFLPWDRWRKKRNIKIYYLDSFKLWPT